MAQDDFDGVINPSAAWPDVPQISTEAIAAGGEDGCFNVQASALVARTKKLRDDVDTISEKVGDLTEGDSITPVDEWSEIRRVVNSNSESDEIRNSQAKAVANRFAFLGTNEGAKKIGVDDGNGGILYSTVQNGLTKIYAIVSAGFNDLSARFGGTMVGADDGSSGSIFTTVQGFITKLLSSAGSSIIGFIQAGTGMVPQTLQDRVRDIQVGFKGAGVVPGAGTDQTALAQALIDYIASIGGGTIVPERGEYIFNNLVLKPGVTIKYNKSIFGYLASGLIRGVTFRSTIAGATIDTPVGNIGNAGVEGIDFKGPGADVPCIGLKLRSTTWGAYKKLSFDNYADQGLLKLAGVANVFEDILTTNCLLNRTRTSVSGCVQLDGGADDFVQRVEANPSLTTISSASLYVVGVLIKASNCFIDKVIGEFADYGIYITGNNNRVSNSRADLNWGGGFHTGGTGQYSTCTSLSNGQAAANTYDGFTVAGQGDTFSNCKSVNTTGSVKYGFNDLCNNSSVDTRNTYDATCKASGYGTAAFKTEGYLGSCPNEPDHPIRTSSATPDFTGTRFGVFTHGSATTVTNFLGGYSGKPIRFLGNTNVTIQNNSNIQTNTGADKILSSTKIYTFSYYNGKWYEAE